MTVRGHIVASLVPGGAYFALTGDPWAGLLALVASILIDVDHVIDRVIEERRISSLPEMVRAYTEDRINKVYVFIHSLDVLIPAWLVFGIKTYLGAMIFGFIFHIGCDAYHWVFKTKKVHFSIYFFVVRLKNNFRFDRFLRPAAQPR